MSKSKTTIEALLEETGPMDSGGLADELVRRHPSQTPEAARKAISRAQIASRVRSTHPVRFDRVYLYYLSSHEGEKYARAVRAVLPKKPGFDRVYKTLLANRGWITAGQIGKSSGSLPDSAQTNAGGRHRLAETVSQLLHLRVLEPVVGATDLFRIGREFGTPRVGKGLFEHKLRIEQGLLEEARDWLRDCYLLAYDKHRLRTSPYLCEGFNDAVWDVHGPVYFGPFTANQQLRRTTAKEAFLVCDILAYRQYDINDATALLERYRSVVLRWKTVVVVPVVIAPVFSASAWQLLRTSGVTPVVFHDVFGRNVEKLLNSLWDLFKQDTPSDSTLTKLEDTLALARGTEINDGIIGNLKGALFELIVALAWRSQGFEVVIQKMVQSKEDLQEYEIDVVCIKADQVCKLIECKGRHAGYEESRDDVERHFASRCKASADPYGWDVTGGYANVEALFITTGVLSPEARAYADATKRSHGISCKVWAGETVGNWLKEIDQPRLAALIDRFYRQ
ncbi:restriction endonuclease [Botrimarina mediterranea]|uniref:Uncharacterized protein n=1 Tax=Botrimarina mediterranea TaxID=2528022 RepID=A0A518K770_9BACT|nr:restriction endonuclease [Botrimarina mediterranea]QDV73638.1 hypothetical protein Spa11_18370 [Botrimarina mediterranea]QDV78228.1 hypothetical protein K2D_18350 [Planctomycetes bacterium K2D]